MRTLVYILFFLSPGLSFCEDETGWSYPPTSIPFTTWNGDTTYYSMWDSNQKTTESASLWRVRRGDTLYEFYPGGNLQSIAIINQTGIEKTSDTSGVEHIRKVFAYNGLCKIYFDDSIKAIAATGAFKNNKDIGEWRYYDKQGRLCGKSYPMTLWTRYDYYDSTGQLMRQIDRIDNGIDPVATVREVELVNGKEVIISNKPLFAKFIIRYAIVISILILLSFFLRIPLNQFIWRREENRAFPIMWFPGSQISYSEVIRNTIVVFGTFWWSTVQKENRRLAAISNALSVFFLASFFGMLVVAWLKAEN